MHLLTSRLAFELCSTYLKPACLSADISLAMTLILLHESTYTVIDGILQLNSIQSHARYNQRVQLFRLVTLFGSSGTPAEPPSTTSPSSPSAWPSASPLALALCSGSKIIPANLLIAHLGPSSIIGSCTAIRRMQRLGGRSLALTGCWAISIWTLRYSEIAGRCCGVNVSARSECRATVRVLGRSWRGTRDWHFHSLGCIVM